MNRNSGYQTLNNRYDRDSVGVNKPRHGSYHSQQGQDKSFLEALRTDQEPQWYWRLIAQASNWMMLGGFLILPTTFNTQPSLRFRRGVLSIIIVAFLTGGYSLTLLLWFACPSLSFRLDSVFLPTASVSTFSFLAILYLIASSSAYNVSSAPCGITLALTASTASLYSALAFFTTRRMKQIARDEQGIRRATVWDFYGPSSLGHSAPGASPDGAASMEPRCYQNYMVNMHPMATRGPSAASDSANPAGVGGFPPPNDEEMLQQKLAMLLRTQGSGPSPDPTQSTFRIEWPIGDDDEINPATAQTRTRTFSASGAELVPPGQDHDRNRTRSATGPMARLGRAMGISGERGRTDVRVASGERKKSREERRREIEMGNVPPVR